MSSKYFLKCSSENCFIDEFMKELLISYKDYFEKKVIFYLITLIYLIYYFNEFIMRSSENLKFSNSCSLKFYWTLQDLCYLSMKVQLFKTFNNKSLDSDIDEEHSEI